jgi:hypothetical protein
LTSDEWKARNEIVIKDEVNKKLGFGCMRLPVVNGKTEEIDDAQFQKMIDTYIAQGFRYFDTAYPYHNQQSEAAVKRCLVDRYDRSTYLLADKMPVWMIKEYADFAQIFAEQRKRCGVEYFDFYLLHALDADRIRKMEEIGGFRFLEERKAAGEIRHIGFSFHDTAAVLEETLKNHPEIEFVQLQINYFDWDSENVQSGACYEVAVKYNIPVIVMEPVKGGTLAGLAEEPAEILRALDAKVSFASYAIRYAASLDNVAVVLSGMSDFDQLLDNTSYMKDFCPLTDAEQQAIRDVVAKLKELPTIPCTGCRYCVDDCPKKILIPNLFTAYNRTLQFGLSDATRRGYRESVREDHAAPADCLKCGKCEGHCPQHLKIRDLLEQVAERFQ